MQLFDVDRQMFEINLLGTSRNRRFDFGLATQLPALQHEERLQSVLPRSQPARERRGHRPRRVRVGRGRCRG